MRKILLVGIAFLGTFVSSAQEITKGELQTSNLAEISERVEKSENRIAKLEKVRQYLKITGFIQGEYDWVEDRDSRQATETSSFYIRRARISMSGDLYKGKNGAKLDYRLYFDLARIPKNPILDMWIRYQPRKEFGVQFGQYKNPVTFEASISPADYDFIDFSYVVQNLAKMGANDVTGYNMTARDMGFQLFGGFVHRDGYSIINYNIGVLNGNGINTKDDNRSKDIYAKLTIKTSKNFAMAAYYQWGEANLSSTKSSDPTKYAEYGWSGNAEYVAMHRWGYGFKYTSNNIFAGAEYIGGITGKLPSEGAYVQGGYKFQLPKQAGRIYAGAMVDYYCRNCFDYIHRNTKNAAIDMRYSLCVGYEPIKYFHIQLAYALEHRINRTFANNRPFGNSVKVMATAIF